MADFAPKASITARGQHPDLDSDGELLDDVHQYEGPKERDFARRWNDIYDTTFKDNYMTRVEAFQRSLPVGVQQFVQGRTYDSPQAYRAGVDLGMQVEATMQGASVLLTDTQIGAMGLEEYDHYFDENGRPRPGVKVHLQRGQILDDTRP